MFVDRLSEAVPPTANAAFAGLHLPFVGFTFTQGSRMSDLGGANQASLSPTKNAPAQQVICSISKFSFLFFMFIDCFFILGVTVQ